MQGAQPLHASPIQVSEPPRLVDHLKGLRPPQRSFAARAWDRFVGKRTMSADKMQLAQLAHSTLYLPPPGKPKDSWRFDGPGDASSQPSGGVKYALDDFVRNVFVTEDAQRGELDWRNPEVAAEAARC